MASKSGYLSLSQKYSPESRGLTDLDVLATDIDWQRFTPSLMTDDDCDAVLQFDGAPSNDQAALLSDKEEAERLTKAFVTLLVKSGRPDVLQYVLVLTSTMLEMSPASAVLFLNREPDPLDVLLKMLNREKDDFIIAKSAAIVGLLISTGNTPAPYLERYNTWILRRLMDSKGDALVAALYSLKLALKNLEFQEIFVKEHGVSMRLTKVLKNSQNHRQVLYLTGFCLWLLSFQKKWATPECLVKAQLMQALVNTLGDRLKPKIVRIILSLFDNLLDNEFFRQLMVLKGLTGVLESLSAEKWEDPDIAPMISSLQKGLAKDIKLLSSFERYEQELRSGQLQAGPVHSSTFWKANAHKFERDEFQLIKELIKLLPLQDDNETVAMSCYDLGEFARFYPEGREIVETLGGKDRIMVLLSHDEETIQKSALLAIQKLLVQNWESMDSEEKSG